MPPAVPAASSLCHLSVAGCTGITDRGVISVLLAAEGLCNLDLSMCPRVTDNISIALTSRAGHLDWLNIEGCHAVSESAVMNLMEVCSDATILSDYTSIGQ